MDSQYNESELKITQTHSIKESKGKALNLDGNQALYLVGAFIVSLILVFYGFVQKWDIISLMFAFLVPLITGYTYLCLFHKDKPPGYQRDLLAKAFKGSDFDSRTDQHRHNPYLRLKKE
jgi:hypothetical protein